MPEGSSRSRRDPLLSQMLQHRYSLVVAQQQYSLARLPGPRGTADPVQVLLCGYHATLHYGTHLAVRGSNGYIIFGRGRGKREGGREREGERERERE
jgi:hypothetical protein